MLDKGKRGKKTMIYKARILVYLCLTLSILSIHAKVNFKSSESTFKIAQGAHLILDNPIDSIIGKVIRGLDAEISGSLLGFNNGFYEDFHSSQQLVGDFQPDIIDCVFLNGDKALKGINGQVFAPMVIVEGENNRIEGKVFFGHDIEMFDSASSLTLAMINRCNKNINLNGGIVFLEEDLHFIDNMSFVGSGLIKANNHSIVFGAQPITLSQPLTFEAAADLTMDCNMIISTTLTFSGYNIINGNHNLFTFGDDGHIVIDRDSTLELRHIQIRGLRDHKIRCVDNTGKILLHDSELGLSGNHSFTLGSFALEGELSMFGDYVYAYQTTMTSTIMDHSLIHCEGNFTFSYDPADGNRHLLAFADSTAQIVFKKSNLHVTKGGLQVTKGSVFFDDIARCAVEGDGRIIVGNGTASDDFYMNFSDGSRLELTQGTLDYRNTQTSSIDMSTVNSMIRINGGAIFSLDHSINLGPGRLQFMDNAVLTRPIGVDVNGSVEFLQS